MTSASAARRIAVVGAGISGLTAAYRLSTLHGDSAAITVFDAAGAPGGTLRTVPFAGTRYDVGTEAFLARRPEMTALVREIGLGDRLVHPTGARAKIRAGGTVLGLPPGTLMGVPVSAEAVADILSPAGLATVAAERTLPPVELPAGDVPLGPLLRNRFGDELVDRLVDPLLGGVYAGGADGLGLRATMPQLASALDKGAGSLTAAAESLLPKTPGSPAPVFGTVLGGLSTVVERLLELSQAELRTGTEVRSLVRDGRRWLVDGVAFDAVVLAVPAPAARRLLAGVAPAASKAFGEVELASMAVVALALPEGTELPEASGVLIGVEEREYSAKAFTFSTRKWAHYGQDGPVVLRGSIGRFGESGVLDRDDAELVGLIRDDLARLTGVTATPVQTLVTRWVGGLPQYSAGHLDLVARIEESTAGLPGLAIAGAALHGVGLPACVATAEAAARSL
jgi:protoporphyrinogen/coproporphyrinogen III oxidase